jgi:hypothetical protein
VAYLNEVEKVYDILMGIRIKGPDDMSAPGVKFEEDSEELEPPEEAPVLVNPVQGDAPPQPENCPGAFGKKPQTYLPVCLCCPVQQECAEKTKPSPT